MKVLLLTSGRSRRMKPVKDKNLLKFSGKTVLEHQLDMLHNLNLTDVLISASAHNFEALQTIAEIYGAKVFEQKNLDDGMAGALVDAEPFVGDEPLIVMGSNDMLAPSAIIAIQEATESDADAYLLSYKVKDYFPGGYLRLDGNRITGIVEKPGQGNEPSEYVNVVLHLYKNPKILFNALREVGSTKDDRYEVALDRLMKSYFFEAVPYEGFWQPIKFPWHVLDLMQTALGMLGSRIDPSADIADTAVIKGQVVIESGVKILDHAVIQGPVYLGKNTVVASGALVRESMIGDRCVIGYATEIARSFVGDDCWFHSNYIGDSILGNNCSFGSGAVCANLRLDEKEIGAAKRKKLGAICGENIRIGVNTSIMPGVRIGSNCMIGSGLTLAEDLEDGKFVYGKTELVIKDNQAQLDPQAREEMREKL